MKTIRDAILIAAAATLAALLINTIRNTIGLNGMAMDTPWPDNREKQILETPPSYGEGDTLISLEQAYALYLGGNAVFLDAREEEEYDEGHITGALNLPFDFWDDYWDYIEPYLDPELEIVAYCGGFDCELSLFAARELKNQGYKKAYIFFGGWQKWVDAGLPTEQTVYDDDYDETEEEFPGEYEDDTVGSEDEETDEY